MAKALILTEKPSVARDVVAALGGFAPVGEDYWESPQFLCTFAVGHILELLGPEEIDEVYKRWNLENLPVIPAEFQLKPKEGQVNRLRVIKKLMERGDVDTIVNACDAGREGELIFREVMKFHGNKKKILRLWLQSMTPNAIREGFRKLEDGKKYEGLGAAAECRAQADWLIGMNATRALTVRLRNRSMKGAWSAGRVQTPTLALLVERELEVLKFLPEPYWQVAATFAGPGHDYAALWIDPEHKADELKPQAKADRLFDQARAEAIVAAVEKKAALARETRKPAQESPRPLFDLTSLQREANSKYGWSAARTLRAAQACYEAHKVLTYPRTSSKCLPNDYVQHVEQTLRVLANEPDYGAAAKFLIQNGRQNDRKIFDDKGVSDHFAIIPTGQIAALQGDDERVFDLVTRRFLAAFHPNAVWENVERFTDCQSQRFVSRARTLREPGWRAVYGQRANEGDEEGKGLPPLVPGNSAPTNVAVRNETAEVRHDMTRPPPRITEARLLSLMENAGKLVEDEDVAAAMSGKGLGTPATRAETIENLKNKEYVDRALRPTAKGIRLIEILRRIKADRLTSADLTGELEVHLGEVEAGERPAGSFMAEIVEYASEIVEITKNFDYDDAYPNDTPLGKCPKCGRPVYERYWFFRCPEDPETKGTEAECDFRIWKDKNGRYIDPGSAKLLLENGRTGELDGFSDRQGRMYAGVLAIVDGAVALHAVAGPDGVIPNVNPGFEVNAEPLAPCPMHPGTACQVVESPTHYVCTERQKQMAAKVKKAVGIYLPRLLCSHEITRAEALEFVNNGETPLIEDFISRWKKPFKAKLKRSATGTGDFEFPPRDPSKARGRFGKKGAKTDGEAPADGAAETNGATPKKAPAKKTPAKKAAADANGEAPKKAPVKKAAKKAASKKAPAKKAAAAADEEVEDF